MDGIVLVDKKENMTSYDVVAKCKRYFNTRKVGHCGTLDPFATGLLIIGINNGTKLMNFIEGDFKEYIACVKLGSETDTLDKTGKIINSSKITPFDSEMLNKAIKSFIGDIMQTPPIYSSIRVNGQHLYSYARQNIKVEIKPRQIHVFDIKVLDVSDDSFTIYVKCSKGTYIRTLGVDIAKSINNIGHLISLRRISIGINKVEDANKIEDLVTNNMRLVPISEALNMKKVIIDDEELLKRVYNGHTLFFKESDKLIMLCDSNHNCIAIYELIENEKYHCLRGLFDENTRYK